MAQNLISNILFCMKMGVILGLQAEKLIYSFEWDTGELYKKIDEMQTTIAALRQQVQVSMNLPYRHKILSKHFLNVIP